MELQFELALLKDIIEKKVAPKEIMSVDVVDGYFTEVRDFCKSETERIENTMRVAMMNIEQETRKKEYILQHQVNAVRLQDKVFGYLLPKDLTVLYNSQDFELVRVPRVDILYKELFLNLEELLRFIEKDFPDHFDKRTKVPDAQCRQLELETEKQIAGIKKGLEGMDVEKWLIDIACMPLEGMLVAEAEVSYHEFYFLQGLLKKLSAFIQVGNYKHATEKLLKLLWRMNYNSVWFVNYCIIEYKRNIKDSEPVDNIQYLQQQEKILKQQTVRKDIAYRTGERTIVEELLQWIVEELRIQYEEQAQVRRLKLQGKLLTLLSVEELGYGGRLLHGAGLFPEIEEGELLELIATSFMTPKSKEISIDSIKNKSGNPGVRSKERVKGYLYEMARKVR